VTTAERIEALERAFRGREDARQTRGKSRAAYERAHELLAKLRNERHVAVLREALEVRRAAKRA